MEFPLRAIHDSLAVLAGVMGFLYFKHRRDVRDLGFGWIGLGFGFYLLNHVGSPLLRAQGLSQSLLMWFAMGSAALALAAFLLGYRLYGGRSNHGVFGSELRLFGVLSLLCLGLLLASKSIGPRSLHLIPAAVLAYGAWMQFHLQRRAPGLGHGIVALALLSHPIALLVMLALGFAPNTMTALLSIPFVVAGILLFSVTLSRSRIELSRANASYADLNRNLEQQVAERTASLEIANAQLLSLSRSDGLTGLANRRMFDERLEHELARRNRLHTTLSLILIDLDYFKRYNDQYGHVAGDDCLRRVTVAISKTVTRATDLVARIGGEEFALILPETEFSAAMGLAEQIRLTVNALDIPHSHSSAASHVTISIGVFTANGIDAIDADELTRRADQQLYRAKNQGRNGIAGAKTKDATHGIDNPLPQ